MPVDATINAIAAVAEIFVTGAAPTLAILTPAATGIDVNKWLMEAKATNPAFFVFDLAVVRTAALTFASTTMVNLLDYFEYIWIYNVYNNNATPGTRVFTTDYAKSYIKAV